MLTNEMEILISRFDDPDLTKSERRQLDDLLQSNPEAQDYHRQLQSLDKRLNRLTAEIDRIDLRGFAREVNLRIDMVETPRRSRRSAWRWLAPLTAAAAVVMIALPWFNRPTITTPAPSSSVVVLAHAKPIDAQPVAQVMVSSAKPPTETSVVRVALASLQPALLPPGNDAQGEIICFAGPVHQRDPIKQTLIPNNNYLVF